MLGFVISDFWRDGMIQLAQVPVSPRMRATHHLQFRQKPGQILWTCKQGVCTCKKCKDSDFLSLTVKLEVLQCAHWGGHQATMAQSAKHLIRGYPLVLLNLKIFLSFFIFHFPFPCLLAGAWCGSLHNHTCRPFSYVSIAHSIIPQPYLSKRLSRQPRQ